LQELKAKSLFCGLLFYFSYSKPNFIASGAVMLEQLNEIRCLAFADLSAAKTSREVDDTRVKYLGRSGKVTFLLREISKLPEAERPSFGQMVNQLKNELIAAIDERSAIISKEEEQKQLASNALDVTLPGRRPSIGRKHIITQTMEDMLEILSYMGFSIEYGPEVESDYYNFEALNFPPDHPARDMQDSFFISDTLLLRTHTSPTQIRVMEKKKPPIRVAMPGKCFRNEAINPRSHIVFHQIEGLYVDEGVTFSDLKGTLGAFLRSYFGKDTKLKFRPSFFPFTEPSAEVDISCFLCKGKGCRVCKNSGWLELLGAGMVDPALFEKVGYDPEKYTGYAWGMGIERLVMMKYGINDIRYYFENDMRFLNQF
jgi:phenylalanyl-tRNA synthetase alpha chain